MTQTRRHPPDFRRTATGTGRMMPASIAAAVTRLADDFIGAQILNALS